MEIFHTVDEIVQKLSSFKEKNLKIGFVPTMGALHKGHLSLINKAKAENEIVVCSIFVNPAQFNNKTDLNNYPRTIESDIKDLILVDCDIVFTPSEKEIYPSPDTDTSVFELGNLDKLMEGKFREGHFNGVAKVVSRLFQIIEPHRAYFGEKDFQQLAIIKYFVKKYHISVEIIPCSTVREADGLAMSSRNVLLGHEERKIAPIIYKTLVEAKEMSEKYSFGKIKFFVEETIKKYPDIQLEYFEIVDAETLEVVSDFNNHTPIVACLAIYLGKVRLIDNIKFL